MAMVILTIAILVGLYLIFQHLEEETSAQRTIANQETLINATTQVVKNQDLIKIVINETRRDNTAFFKILDNMAQAEIDDDKREAVIGAKFTERLDNITEKIDNLTKMIQDTRF